VPSPNGRPYRERSFYYVRGEIRKVDPLKKTTAKRNNDDLNKEYSSIITNGSEKSQTA